MINPDHADDGTVVTTCKHMVSSLHDLSRTEACGGPASPRGVGRSVPLRQVNSYKVRVEWKKR